jgi:uncharacterized membrane protein YeaQ/YmgE (transglycosylase-associated protein family)
MEIFAGHGWIMTIIIGGLAGAVGKWIMPGKDPGGLIVTILLGIAGALLVTLLGTLIGWYEAGEGAGFIGAVIGSIILLFIYRKFNGAGSGPAA